MRWFADTFAAGPEFGLPSLTLLDLNYNDIRHVSSSVFDAASRLQTLLIKRNPMACSVAEHSPVELMCDCNSKVWQVTFGSMYSSKSHVYGNATSYRSQEGAKCVYRKLKLQPAWSTPTSTTEGNNLTESPANQYSLVWKKIYKRTDATLMLNALPSDFAGKYLGEMKQSTSHVQYEAKLVSPPDAELMRWKVAIDPATGTVYIDCARVGNYTLVVSAHDGAGSAGIAGADRMLDTVTVKEWSFTIQHADSDLASNGPHGQTCLHGGLAVDDVEFDGAFICNCSQRCVYADAFPSKSTLHTSCSATVIRSFTLCLPDWMLSNATHVSLVKICSSAVW